MVTESLETKARKRHRPTLGRVDWAPPGQFEVEIVETEPQRATLLIFRTKRFLRPRFDEYHAMLMLTAEALENEW